jgi:hypothetical protein
MKEKIEAPEAFKACFEGRRSTFSILVKLNHYENICFVFDHRANADRVPGVPGVPDPEGIADDGNPNPRRVDEHPYRKEDEDHFGKHQSVLQIEQEEAVDDFRFSFSVGFSFGFAFCDPVSDR